MSLVEKENAVVAGAGEQRRLVVGGFDPVPRFEAFGAIGATRSPEVLLRIRFQCLRECQCQYEGGKTELLYLQRC